MNSISTLQDVQGRENTLLRNVYLYLAGGLALTALVSFALCYIVMLLETYLLYIVIGLGVLLTVVIVLAIVLYIRHRKV